MASSDRNNTGKVEAVDYEDVDIRGQRTPREHKSLLAQLKRQVKYLQISSMAFDAGEHDEAVRLAVTLRVMLHDNKKQNAISLLTHLKYKDTLRFIDTGIYRKEFDAAIDLMKSKSGAHFIFGDERPGLTVTGPLQDGTFGFIPPLDTRNYPSGHPLFSTLMPAQQFVPWWTRGLVEDSKRRRFSRETLILIMANQDGGAHVDKGLHAAYAELCEDNLGMHREWGNGPAPDNWLSSAPPPVRFNIAFASVRQIAHEVIRTLQLAGL